MDPTTTQSIMTAVNDSIDTRFRVLEDSINDGIDTRFRVLEVSINESIDTRFRGFEVSINERLNERFAAQAQEMREHIRQAVAEAMEMQKNGNDDLQCSVGVCDFVWAFRRFWLPVCPKAWTKFD